MSLSNNQKICSIASSSVMVIFNSYKLSSIRSTLRRTRNFEEKVDSEKAEIAGDATIRPALFALC